MKGCEGQLLIGRTAVSQQCLRMPPPSCTHMLATTCAGVGGEYPLAASSAAERAEGDPELRKRRGEMVVLTFSQQGWGNFTNTVRAARGPVCCRCSGH